MLTLLMMLCFCVAAQAQLKASLAQMPMYAESLEKGVLVDMVKAISEASGKKIEIQVVPFKRSMDNVINRKVDFHAPLIVNPQNDEKTLNYDHSTEIIFHVNFCLYTNNAKPIDIKKLKEYKIETDAAHVPYFDFPIISSPDLESSLKKVNAGRIDGFIFADQASDPIIANLKLTHVKKALYHVFDVRIILPKGEKGGATDKLLSAAIGKLRKSGKWVEIMGIIDQPYKD